MLEQLRVRARGRDATVVEHDDLVAAHDRGEPVRDEISDNLTPIGRISDAASTMIRFRRAAETPSDIVLEARP